MLRKRRVSLSLTRCDSGVTAVEFALLAPVLFLLIMGIIEFAVIMFVSVVLESATNQTSRLGKTGFIAAGLTRQQEIINNVASHTAGLLNPNQITITSEVYANFNDIGQPEPCLTQKCGAGVAGVDYVDVNGNGKWDADMGAAGLGNPGDVVVYTVSYPWHIMTPIVSAVIGKTLTLSARSVVRNEPYGN